MRVKMKLKRVGIGFGDFLTPGTTHDGRRHIDKLIRLNRIWRITDPAELPEYLTDEDPDVVEAAKRKLKELT